MDTYVRQPHITNAYLDEVDDQKGVFRVVLQERDGGGQLTFTFTDPEQLQQLAQGLNMATNDMTDELAERRGDKVEPYEDNAKLGGST